MQAAEEKYLTDSNFTKQEALTHKEEVSLLQESLSFFAKYHCNGIKTNYCDYVGQRKQLSDNKDLVALDYEYAQKSLNLNKGINNN
jgi:hypothetical protein